MLPTVNDATERLRMRKLQRRHKLDICPKTVLGISYFKGWCKEFSDRGADSTDDVAKTRLKGYYKWKNLRINSFSPSDGGL